MQQFTSQQVAAYIESKKLAWSPTSIKSEWARLRQGVKISASCQSATEFFAAMQQAGQKPYSIKTMFIRMSELAKFATGGEIDNEFSRFLRMNALVFKNAYKREKVGVTYLQAVAAIQTICNIQIRNIAQFMLQSGLRVTEAINYDGSGEVIGKGNKRRVVYCKDSSKALATEGLPPLMYMDIYKALKDVGLKPHTLRKLAASQLVAAGFKEADLMEVMGWNSMQTAAIYIQPANETDLKRRVQEALHGV